VRNRDRYYLRAARNPFEDDPHGERTRKTRSRMDSEAHELLLRPFHSRILNTEELETMTDTGVSLQDLFGRESYVS
jgi:hypothetical protein